MKERGRKAIYRLAYVVPLAPWPVAFWLQTFPLVHTGLDTKNALAYVNGPLFAGAIVTTLLGLTLICFARIIWEDVAVWVVFAVIYHFVFVEYVAANVYIQTIK